MTEEDLKQYTFKQKIYLGKLVNNDIKLPKPETLSYYKIVKEGKVYKITEDQIFY